jgi:hypothetical protein
MLPPNLSTFLVNLKKTRHVDTAREQARKDMIAELEQVSKTLDNAPASEQIVYRTFGATSTNVWGGSLGKCAVCGK